MSNALRRETTSASSWGHCVVAIAALAIAIGNANVRADTIVPATYDVDSYMFVGSNSNLEHGLSLSRDFTEGVVAQNNAHFIFGVIKFDDLSGLRTKANGGGDKFLELSTHNFIGPSTFAVSIAKADIDADDGTGYPSPLFPGNLSDPRDGSNIARLGWYMANIKGDNAEYGGYAGGAEHVGILSVPTAGTHQVNVTAAIDEWLTGESPNFGFGLWSVNDPGTRDSIFDFASLENPNGNGPRLVVTGESSTPLIGDANNDGFVDRRDLAQLMASYGLTSGATWADGDFDDNRAVTLADVIALKNHFTPVAGSSAAAVPEPSGTATCFLGAIGWAVSARRRRKSTQPCFRRSGAARLS